MLAVHTVLLAHPLHPCYHGYHGSVRQLFLPFIVNEEAVPMSAQPRQYLTIDDYLTLERTSPQKHEYYAGEIFALAGGSVAHNLIATNITGMLYNQLRRRPCTVYASDLRVKIPATGLYTYPDIVLVCGELHFEDDHQDTLLNPMVIIEILSPSTENYDRGKKFQNYRTIPSFTDYLLVNQNNQYIEHYQRQSNYQWLLSEYKTADARMHIVSIDCTVLLEEVYEKVVLVPETAAETETE